MSTMKIIDDDEAVQNLIDQALGDKSPFNLERDYKTLFGKEIFKYRAHIYQELSLELQKPKPSFIKLKGIECQQIDVIVSKLRSKDPKSKKSKSEGIRCIMLIDWKVNEAMIIHLYSKSKKTDLSKNDVSCLSIIHKLYIQSSTT